ncbi:hypothetical protein DSECCO2_464390 [anaerobic digester metagenome]
MTVPRIDSAFDNAFKQCVSDKAQSCKFPFSFGREAVLRQHDSVFHTYFTCSGTVGIQVIKVVFNHTFELSGQICIGIEVLFVLLIGVNFKDTFTDHDILVHTVGSPFTVAVCLYPAHTNNRIECICRMTEVVLHIRLIVTEA